MPESKSAGRPKAPKGAGKSSFELINTDTLQSMLPVQEGATILDLACGKGFYSLFLAPLAGDNGLIYATDLWEQGLEMLEQEAGKKNITNIRTIKEDATEKIHIDSHSVDLCLMATVLHDFKEMNAAKKVLAQVKDLLKPGGCLAVVEFKKIDGPPGPPAHIRLSPDETRKLATDSGFTEIGSADLGEYNYMMTFKA